MDGKDRKSFVGRLDDYSQLVKGLLSGNKGRDLLACSMAAGTGFGIVAPVEAAIVHNAGFTTTITLGGTGFGLTTTGSYTQTFKLDINDDGNDDWKINFSYYVTSCYPCSKTYNWNISNLRTHVNDGIAVTSGGIGRTVSYLSAGASINTALTWNQNNRYTNMIQSTDSHGTRGNFRNGNGYIGVKFNNAGAVNYGWIHVEHSNANKELKILGWAYEDCADVAIAAGETAATQCPPPPPATIPTLTEWGQCVFILILAALAIRSINGRKEEESI